MGNILEQTKKQLDEFYTNMDKKQKIKIGASGLIIVLSITLLMYYLTRPQYVTLYDELNPKKAGEITKKLDEVGIPWKDDETGNSILVPKEYKNTAKAQLAMEGIPGERFSYESMLTNSSLTMTNEERKNRYEIAQTNSIAQTIEAIEGITWAWVDLTIADDSNFITQNKKSKASVFVELEEGYKLNKKQVDGIVMLVTNSVKSLDPKDVSIVNNKGEVLTKSDNGEEFDASNQLALQEKVQNELREDITGFLATIYGNGNVAVMVNAKLDFDSEETSVLAYEPPIKDETNGLVRSMNESNEKSVNNPISGGVPGIDSNEGEIPEYLERTSSGSEYNKNNKTINYELNETRKKLVKAQGQVKDITVAVLINSNILPGKELTEENKNEIIGIVSASAGLDTKVVKVMAKSFDNTIADRFEEIKNERTGITVLKDIPVWALGVIGVFIIGLLGFIAYSIQNRKKKQETERKMSTDLLIDEEFDEIEISEKSEYKKQINKFVEKNPQAVSQLLKNWLNEE
ncbi:flagellar basal-body MS-ring/collar protein FliF [Anaeromicrobium sediminis]|uniref:Flagellar M-ring protein n=1 Tax=Anaeromicrobium sediminis TaxID=1478221 RepID=A0A267MQT2_9FIRM|nr:flagellar basal-body MS-ring/collar protein FliF [Anaeromicrobium sediminis]PAB61275.1 flagellar M-ring protein FliF [Anaeromicrobium sediminis]